MTAPTTWNGTGRFDGIDANGLDDIDFYLNPVKRLALLEQCIPIRSSEDLQR